jgi:hypothetical protein
MVGRFRQVEFTLFISAANIIIICLTLVFFLYTHDTNRSDQKISYKIKQDCACLHPINIS